uniref:DUF177 domain-containing protein n=1 Tax=Pararhizobium sp. IMCC3301 TaxID=3067904 RepID=UPI00274135F0|nr:DUF177 domain-containing protein [Pararhizobium sp. IMCC3301]
MTKVRTASNRDANLPDKSAKSAKSLKSPKSPNSTSSTSSTSSSWSWTYPVVAGDITSDAKDIVIQPDKADYGALADELNVLGVLELKALLRIHRTRKSLRIRGHVDAVVEQSCVVTLEPVRQTLHEEIDRTFVTDRDDIEIVASRLNSNREMMIDPEEIDPPEIIEKGRLDLAAIALEHVVLGLDLYPRAAGAEPTLGPTETSESSAELPPESPFAALARLKVAESG